MLGGCVLGGGGGGGGDYIPWEGRFVKNATLSGGDPLFVREGRAQVYIVVARVI